MSEPVVNLCEVQQVQTPVRNTTHLQRLMRSKPGAIAVILFSSLFGVLPTVAYAPICFFLIWAGVVSHYSLRRFIDICFGSWLALINFIFETVLGVQTKTFGFHGKFKRRSLFIMNHVTHLDWLYFWSVVGRHGDLLTWKVVTKNNIRHLPLLGQSMQCCCFIFIARNWEKDENELRDKLYYYNSLDYPCQLLLFPEGGDLTYKSKSRSDNFADKEGLTRYKYCLHPRTRGFVYIMSALRSGELDAVYDVTIAYPDNLPKTEVDFVNGVMPHEVHFHIKNYNNKDLPDDDEELAHWCQEKWQEKEERLHLFYSHRKFVEPVTCNSSTRENGVHQVEEDGIHQKTDYWQLTKHMLVLVTINAVVAFFLYLSWFFVVYFVLAFVFMMLFSHYAGGYDGILLALQRVKIEEAIKKSKKHCSAAS